MTKLYSKKSNAKRAAIQAEGPEAIEGVDYQLIKRARGWTWEPIRPAQATVGSDAEPAAGESGEAAKSGAEPEPSTAAENRSRTRADLSSPKGSSGFAQAGSKQARMVELLRRPEGATVDQIAEATGWQKHTVRGAMSGALKKKLGLDIASEKVEGRGRVYRVVGAA